MINWHKYVYHKGQQDFSKALFDPGCNTVAVAAARRCGKTDIITRAIVARWRHNTGFDYNRYLITAPTSGQAKRIYWEALLKYIPKNEITYINSTEATIKSKFNSEIQLHSLENSAVITGQNDIAGIVIDEICDARPGFWQEIQPMQQVIGRTCFIWLAGVPRIASPSGPWFKDFIDKINLGQIKNAKAFTWSADGILSQEAIDALHSSMDEREFQQEIYANWKQTGGLVFYNFDTKQNVATFERDKNALLYISCDFNVDNFSWIAAQPVGNELHVIDEIRASDAYTEDMLTEAFRRYQDHKGRIIFTGDASGKNRHTSNQAQQTDKIQIQNHDGFRALHAEISFNEGNKRVEDRNACVTALLNSNGLIRLKVDSKCKWLLNDLMNLAYKENTRIPDTTNKKMGHMSDALGYLVQNFYPLQLPVVPGETRIYTSQDFRRV
jgi:hypothetical protein